METSLLYVRPERAAEMLAISRAHLFRLLASGAIPSVKFGRSRRIPVAALRQWESTNKDAPRHTKAAA